MANEALIQLMEVEKTNMDQEISVINAQISAKNQAIIDTTATVDIMTQNILSYQNDIIDEEVKISNINADKSKIDQIIAILNA